MPRAQRSNGKSHLQQQPEMKPDAGSEPRAERDGKAQYGGWIAEIIFASAPPVVIAILKAHAVSSEKSPQKVVGRIVPQQRIGMRLRGDAHGSISATLADAWAASGLI